MNKQKGFAPIILVLIALGILVVGGGAYYYQTTKQAKIAKPVACTEEAKICPDGSSVGRTGSNCEFAECPVVNGVVSENTIVKVYFPTPDSEQLECNDVVAVERIVLKTVSTGTAALEQLLKGPTTEEKDKGYTTSIPAGSKLNSLVIVNGEARVDFNAMTESGGGSCSMGVRMAQIRQTLLQFPTVKTISLSINGRTKDIFQP